jgi:hypothetical protein
MITRAVSAIKTALLDLRDTAGVAIFTDDRDILTGFPDPSQFRKDLPLANHPLVVVHLASLTGQGMGYKEYLAQTQVLVGTEHHDYTQEALGDLVMQVEIHILAKTMDELTGDLTRYPNFRGYIDQVLAIVRKYPEIVGDNHTQIFWDWGEGDLFIPPGSDSSLLQRLVFGTAVKTVVWGKFVPTTTIDAASVTTLNVHGTIVPADTSDLIL